MYCLIASADLWPVREFFNSIVKIGIPLINKTTSIDLLLFGEYFNCLTKENIFFLYNSSVSGFNPLLGSKYNKFISTPRSFIPLLNTSIKPLFSISEEILSKIFFSGNLFWGIYQNY